MTDTTTHTVYEYVVGYKNRYKTMSFREIVLCDPEGNHAELLRKEFMKKNSFQDIEIKIEKGLFVDYVYDAAHPDATENDFISMAGNGACASYDDINNTMIYTSKYPIHWRSITCYTAFYISHQPYGIQIQIIRVIIHFCSMYVLEPIIFFMVR